MLPKRDVSIPIGVTNGKQFMKMSIAFPERSKRRIEGGNVEGNQTIFPSGENLHLQEMMMGPTTWMKVVAINNAITLVKLVINFGHLGSCAYEI